MTTARSIQAQQYIVYDATGKILRTGIAPEDHINLQARDGEFVMVGTADDRKHMIKDGKVVAKPPEPPPEMAYDVKRVREYPPIVDFVDAYYWQQRGDPSKMEAYLAQVDAVKKAFPKS